ncbi:MAG: hypothetical protein JWL79_1300 [Frankiales bacterium]|nr:hypothetical protein [Frankiales bacterium]
MSGHTLAKVYHYNGPGQTLILIAVAIFAIVCGLLYVRSMSRAGRRARERRDGNS